MLDCEDRCCVKLFQMDPPFQNRLQISKKFKLVGGTYYRHCEVFLSLRVYKFVLMTTEHDQEALARNGGQRQHLINVWQTYDEEREGLFFYVSSFDQQFFGSQFEHFVKRGDFLCN